ncbi:MAG: glycosyltransferase family 2 protein [Gammaproteobacteria bacterium]|nr:glycosyltransferase family 2 protein [Gammaproteobacteria bacterium]
MLNSSHANLPSLSVVIPCLNEEDNLKSIALRTLQAFIKYEIKGELIIINDGSSDNTGVVALELSRQHSSVRVIEHNKPHGIGASFWDGVHAAKNDFVVLLPGDGEIEPEDALVYYHLTTDVDIVVPFIHNVEVRSIWRRVISSIYRFIINMSFGTNLNYTNGTVIYNRAILDGITLKSKGFLYQAELLINLIRAGYLYAETPHFLMPRNAGETKALTFKSFLQVVNSYLVLMWEVHAARRMGRPGIISSSQSVTYRRQMAWREHQK